MARVDFPRRPARRRCSRRTALTWRVMKNPVALIVGGIAAVILELAEPRVRTGVWEHTTFRADPVTRMKPHGLAAMVTVYAPADAARAMIAGVGARAWTRRGRDAGGRALSRQRRGAAELGARDGEFGFFEAYQRFVRRLSRAEIDRFYAEGADRRRALRRDGAPRSGAEMARAVRGDAAKARAVADRVRISAIVRRAPACPRARCNA